MSRTFYNSVKALERNPVVWAKRKGAFPRAARRASFSRLNVKYKIPAR